MAVQPTSGRPGQRALPGVSGRLTGLLSEDSPYIRQARSRAERMANRRGLQNSSIAAGAGEEAAIASALPIAQGDAQIAAGERGLESQEFQQQRQITSAEMMQQRQIKSTEGIAKAERELRDLMQQREHRVQQLMQKQRLSHDAAQRQADREMQSSIAAAQRQVQRETLKSSSEIATMNAASRNYATYQGSVDRINANTDLPPDERAEQLKQAQQQYDVQNSITQQITGKKYKWPARQPDPPTDTSDEE